MERITDHHDVPLELLHGIRTHRRGLHAIELQQSKGRSGYTAVRNARWQLEAESGEAPTHEEEPAEELADVARTVYAEAMLANNEGGQGLFQVVLYVATKEGGSKHTVKFSIGPETVVDGREEHAKASLVDSMRMHITDLYAVNLRASIANSRALEYVGRVLPGLIEIRLDAIDDRAEAMLEGLGAGRKKKKAEPEEHPWKPAADTVRDALKTFGPAVAMKTFGLDAEQARALFSDGSAGATKAEVKVPAANATLREMLVAFGESLTEEQKPMLFLALDATLIGKLQDAAKANSERQAAQLCAEVLDAVSDDEKKAEALQALLTKPQAELLKRCIDTIESIQGQ